MSGTGMSSLLIVVLWGGGGGRKEVHILFYFWREDQAVPWDIEGTGPTTVPANDKLLSRA